jgi:hypothetical protein
MAIFSPTVSRGANVPLKTSLLNRFRPIATYHAPNLPQADSNK